MRGQRAPLHLSTLNVYTYAVQQWIRPPIPIREDGVSITPEVEELFGLTCGGDWTIIRRLCLVSFLVTSLLMPPTVTGVPKRVANRMVPSWWSTASKICLSGNDCLSDECCTRPMLSLNAYCMPMRTRGQVCNPSPFLLNENDQRYFNDCPCQPQFACAIINKDIHASCVDLHELEVDFKRYVTNMKPVSNFLHRGIPAARKTEI